jgi:hypothetical protein
LQQICLRWTYSLSGFLGEVVGGEESAGDAGVETGEAVVGGVDNGILEATRVLQVQVELAVLGVVGGLSARANVGLELVETVGDDLFTVSFSNKWARSTCVSQLTVLSVEVVVDTLP